jgi:hypothetical protein
MKMRTRLLFPGMVKIPVAANKSCTLILGRDQLAKYAGMPARGPLYIKQSGSVLAPWWFPFIVRALAGRPLS